MATVPWQVSGEYMEACSCDSVCPCPTSGLAARPTKGSCDAGLVFRVDRGRYGDTTLDGLGFAVLLHTPGPMIEGNWTVGVIVDSIVFLSLAFGSLALLKGQVIGKLWMTVFALPVILALRSWDRRRGMIPA